MKNFLRIRPPLIITEAQLDDVIGRRQSAIERSVAGHPKDIDFTASNSLAAAGGLQGCPDGGMWGAGRDRGVGLEGRKPLPAVWIEREAP